MVAEMTLSVEARRALVASDGAVDSKMLEIAEATAGQFGMPLAGITILGGKPYINATGLTWLVQHDGRKVKALTTKKVRDAWDNKEDRRAEYRAFVEFADGSRFEADGFASMQSVRMGSMKNPDFINMLCETRALNRAMRRATGCSLTSVEEMDRAAVADLGTDQGMILEGTVLGAEEKPHPGPAPAPTLPSSRRRQAAPAPPAAPPLDPEMEALRLELAELLDRFPDARKKLQDAMAAANATTLTDTGVRKAVASLRERAATEAQQNPEQLAVDMTKDERLAQTIPFARSLCERLRAAGTRPTPGEIGTLRTYLAEIQRCEPLADDTPVERIADANMLAAVEERLAVADQPKATSSADDDPENVPF